MRANSNTKQRRAGGVNGGGAAALRLIPLAEIEPSPRNTRRRADAAGLKALAESVRRQGVLQPILVREIKATGGGAKYQVVAGERRLRAAREAGLKAIPAQVRLMDEAEALGAQIVENLQREDVHPLDEADGYLRMKDEMKLSVRDIAARVAKDARYVARRLALTNLIAPARDDFRKERVTLAHALEICRLAPEIQARALAACYETTTVYDKGADAYENRPDKTRPARHVRYLLDWLARHVHLNLSRAPFELDDARLREDGLACLSCPERSGFDRALFSDIRDADVCLNPVCYEGKLQAFVRITRAEVEAKTGKPAALISAQYRAGEGGALGRGEYEVIARKGDRCEFAEPAVCADGGEVGQVRWVCREPTCKDHLGRVPEYRQHSATGGVQTATTDRRERRQELFDVVRHEARNWNE
jgi:ParB family transcriptional regulator, chromosome partitioning protein